MKKAVVVILGVAAIGLLLFLFKNNSKIEPTPTFPKLEHASSTAPAPAQPLSTPLAKIAVTDHDRKLLSDLNQIFASRNDNDPRLDSEFKNLTPGTKQLLLEKYQQLPLEARNERGTIVFLIGRELNRPEDCHFLAQVTTEPPCLNLADCKKAPPHTDEDVHEEPAISVTLAYPQHVAVKSMEKFLSQKTPDPTLLDTCLGALDQMTESPIGVIARKASDLRNRSAGIRNEN